MQEALESAKDLHQQHPYATEYLIGCIISFILWAAYLEINPQIGGVWYRANSTGHKRLKISGILPMLTYPFRTFHFWLPQNWDLNWLMATSFGATAFVFFNNIDTIRENTFNLFTSQSSK